MPFVLSCFSGVRLCDPMDCSLPGFSVHGILQARILQCVAISSSRGSSPPRDRTWVSCIAGGCWSPAPAARDSTWRGERCRQEKLRQPLILLGLPVYFKLMILFYTFIKALGQRFSIFSSHGPRFIFLQKSLLPLKRILSDSLIYFFSCVLVNTL